MVPLTPPDIAHFMVPAARIHRSFRPGVSDRVAGFKTDWAATDHEQELKRLAAYNCLAWTLNRTDKHLWPQETADDVNIEVLRQYYRELGRPVTAVEDVDSHTADIACYGNKDGKNLVNHVALRRRPAHPFPEFEWESKMGQHIRMIHRAEDLEWEPDCYLYGVVGYLKFKGRRTAPPGATA
jgi:hypothetical protein